MIARILRFAEVGAFPDWMIRIGIRRLLSQRLRDETAPNFELAREKEEKIIAALKQMPIAIVPEKANQQHYEVSPDFFYRSLGRRMKYSCCLWDSVTKDLEAAEEAALKVTTERANIRDGMKILELGCGWGSLSLYLAENFPKAQILAISNSHSQREFILDRIEKKKIQNLKIQTADMNDFESSGALFDRVISIEMFEHMRNYRLLLKRISQWLKPDGKVFVHIFTHRDLTYTFETEGEDNWFAQHFFTGGIMPSEHLLARFQEDLSLEKTWRWNGKNYAKTSNAWLKRMDDAREQILASFIKTYGESEAKLWFQRWRIFFMATAEMFDYGQGDEWFVSHYLFSKKA